LSVTSQIGDLVISFFKRKANLDDTGKIIPGHGGLLDSIDGMIFAFPLTYLFVINNFN
jgi:phosphatidate cytidylyltransferase